MHHHPYKMIMCIIIIQCNSCIIKLFQLQMKPTTRSTFDVIFIELVALLHSAEASVLPDGPRSVGVHGGIGPPSLGKHSRQFIRPVGGVCFGVYRLNVESLRRVPDQIFRVLPLQLFLSQRGPFGMQLDLVPARRRRVHEGAVCWENRGSRHSPGSHRCTCPLCSQHASMLIQSDAHGSLKVDNDKQTWGGEICWPGVLGGGVSASRRLLSERLQPSTNTTIKHIQ